AMGRVSALNWDGKFLYADIENVPAELAVQISSGAYPFRSAEISRSRDGIWRLIAVSLLGARAPAVKGLGPMPAPAEYSAEENQAAYESAFALRQVSRTEQNNLLCIWEGSMPQTNETSPAGERIELAEENHRLAA